MAGPVLDRESALPLHEQLSERLTSLVQELGSGGRLPTEEELMKTYGVSRTTVRRAIQALVDTGVLTRRQGHGTFVRPPHIIHPLNHLRPFLETRSTLGKPPTTRLVDFEWITGEAVPVELRLSPHPSALRFRRLYSTDGMAHALADITLREDLARGISRADAESRAAYRLLEDAGAMLKEARCTVSCAAAGVDLASLLGIKRSQPVLLWRRVTVDTDDRPVEVTAHWLDPDVYDLEVVLHPENATLALSRQAGLT
jgi:GntR family transcriptional regulator